MTSMNAAAYAIAVGSALAIIFRPFQLPEYVYALAGAALVLLLGVIAPNQAFAAVLKGGDVYLFLTGMMLLSEAARQEGVFDWAASRAAQIAQGSAPRLFLLIYAVGVLTTVFLSNDATAVVLTPAVFAAARKAKADPLPYLLICAFVANAASFVLPISNPANLVMYAERMPPLSEWFKTYALPSVAAIASVYFVLRWLHRRDLREKLSSEIAAAPLTLSGRCVLAGLAFTALVLLAASYLGWDLGAPTFVCGVAISCVSLLISRVSPLALIKHISWGVLPLVAGLFILVTAVEQAGALHLLAQGLKEAAQTSPRETAVVSGVLVGLLTNFMNNLPCGLLAATTAHLAHAPSDVAAGLLIGVDIGPNLTISGSLASMLWLIVLRREGVAFSSWNFFKIGLAVAPPALILALACLYFF